MTRISKNRIDMEDGRVERAHLRDYGETVVGGSAGINAGEAYTVDLENGNVFNLILNEATCELSFTNAFPSGAATSFTLMLKQDSTGGREVTWPSNIMWPGDNAPTLTTTANEADIFSFITINAGALWFGVHGGTMSESLSQTLWSWGLGTTGELGTNSASSISSPTMIGSATAWVEIAGGRSHTIARRTDGTLWAWGVNTDGQLGKNNTVNISSPTQIGADKSWNVIAAAGGTAGQGFNFAVKSNGTMWAWGTGTNGRLGIPPGNVSSPIQIGSDPNWKTIAIGSGHGFAIKTNNTLWSWGTGSSGRLGHNDAVFRSSPAQVGNETNWQQITAGVAHTVGLKTNGTLWTWGSNDVGQLGLNAGVTAHHSSPTQVGTASDWVKIAAGQYSSFAINASGQLWSWGDGAFGRTGHNSASYRSSPTQIGTSTNWDSIAVGSMGYHAAAIKTDGSLWTWGTGTSGQLGENGVVSRSSPAQVGNLKTWSKVTVARDHTIATQFPTS